MTVALTTTHFLTPLSVLITPFSQFASAIRSSNVLTQPIIWSNDIARSRPRRRAETSAMICRSFFAGTAPPTGMTFFREDIPGWLSYSSVILPAEMPLARVPAVTE